MARLSLAVTCVLVCAGCEPPACVDLDDDGFGEHCALGPDCDETNADRTDDCDVVPPPDCVAVPTATGCPCLPGTVIDCLAGADPMSIDVGICRAGRALCLSRHVGACVGGVRPLGEICDGVDQDCDGLTDEDVLSPCGGCDSSCSGGVWGESAAPFVADAAAGTDTTALGELTLARIPTEHTTLYVANSAEGTLSRIDDGEPPAETARYRTGGLEPSRVAVDWNGDAWVANRELLGGIPTVTRIAGELGRCVDRDGDGTIRTSRGGADVLAFGDDECVLATTVVGEEAEVARAMAIDGDRGLDDASGGNAWVGLHDGQAIVEVDGLSGVVTRRIETPGFSPYAAAFDPWGRLWMSSRDGLLLRLDPRSEPPDVRILEIPLSCWLAYSLAIDEDGRIALTGFSCDRVTVYDPATERWGSVVTEPSPRGAIFAGERLYVSHTGGTLTELALAPLRIGAVIALADDDHAVGETIGVGATSTHVWAIAREGDHDGPGRAVRVAIDGVRPDAYVDVGLAPHTQGDLTGAELGSEAVPEGVASHVFAGCPDGMTVWARLHVAIDAGSTGEVDVAFRYAENEGALGAASFAVLGTFPTHSGPFPLSLPDGGVLEVQLTLRVEGRIGSPRVRRIGVEWACPGPD